MYVWAAVIQSCFLMQIRKTTLWICAGKLATRLQTEIQSTHTLRRLESFGRKSSLLHKPEEDPRLFKPPCRVWSCSLKESFNFASSIHNYWSVCGHILHMERKVDSTSALVNENNILCIVWPSLCAVLQSSKNIPLCRLQKRFCNDKKNKQTKKPNSL